MSAIPFRKFFVSLLVLFIISSALKWSVDVCLDVMPGVYHQRLFPRSLPAPKVVCDAVSKWDLWSRTRQAEVDAMRNFYNAGPGAFETDDGKPAILLFSKDLEKLPLLLRKIPGQRVPLIQVVMVMVLTSAFVAVLWEWAAQVFSGTPPPLGDVSKSQDAKPFKNML